MTDFDLDAVFLAGFTMAHAVRSVSDTPDDELLVPLAIVTRNGERQLMRFEADSQVEASLVCNLMLTRRRCGLDGHPPFTSVPMTSEVNFEVQQIVLRFITFLRGAKAETFARPLIEFLRQCGCSLVA